MALPSISTVLAGIQHIPDKATQDLLEFDVAATQFATEMQTLGSQANTWAGEVNTLKAAINVILGLLQNPLDPPADILRYLRSPGDIVWTSAPTAGPGTLLADGSAVSRTTYADLWVAYNAAGWDWTNCTISVASPCIVTDIAHGLPAGARLRIKATGGTLPTGIDASTDYFVVPIDVDTFHLSTAQDAPLLLNTTGAGTGTLTYCRSIHGLGNGTTTFNLPNLCGIFPRGQDCGRGIDPDRVLGSLQADMIKAHTHPTENYWVSGSGFSVSNANGYNVQNAQATGSSGGSETRPMNMALLPCVVY